MQRAVWTAAEILSEYQSDIEAFEFETGSGGDFEFFIDGALVYSKQATGEYPALGELKQAVVSAIDARGSAA